MAKMRVWELAKELGIDSKKLLALLNDRGEFVRSASSTLEPHVVRWLRSPVPDPTAVIVAGNAGDTTLVLPNSSSAAGTSLNAAGVGDAQSGVTRSGWHAGPIAAPRDPALARHISDLCAHYTAAATHIDALKRLGSQFVHVNHSFSKGFTSVYFARVRFSGAIENGFGFTREALFVYSPFVDLHSRLVSEIRRELATCGPRITPDIVFVSAPDTRLRSKLDDWTSPELLLIPLDVPMDENPQAFITLLRDYLHKRDLFYETTAVSGSKFFGRRRLLQALRDDVKMRRVAGVFGLRKAGKTSVMTELANTLGPDVVPILMDLETFPAPPLDPTPDILNNLRIRLRDALHERGLRTKEMADLPEFPSITEWKAAAQVLLKRLDRDSIRVLLMLDEVEYLTPDNVDVAEGGLPQIAQLLGAFRSLVQETPNFTFLLSGLTSAITEGGRLYGRPNPLFSWAKTYYLAPFLRGEADELATTVGRKMGIDIDPSGLAALHDGSGGHAFLYRSLASAVVQSLPEDAPSRTIRAGEVDRAFLPWKRRVAGNVKEMMDHVKRYYPLESWLLDILIDEPESFGELAAVDPQALQHLLDLGLVIEVDHHYELNSLLELMR